MNEKFIFYPKNAGACMRGEREMIQEKQKAT